MKRILIVDDDLATCAAIKSFFRSDYEVKALYDGARLDAETRSFVPDLIMLDINLPGKNGLRLLQDLAEIVETVPVFMISVRGGEEDIVRAFDLGAADYVTKPFSLVVLKARLQRWLGRKASAKTLALGAATLDLANGEIVAETGVVTLTRKELLTLRFLLANAGQVMTRAQILGFAWGYDYEGTSRTVDNTIANLRRKLVAAGLESSDLISSHSGLGYRLTLPDSG